MKLLITGISGYLGMLLSMKLSEEESIDSITGVDIKEPSFNNKKLKFFKLDIRSPQLSDVVTGCDVAVHLAFIVEEIKDKKLTYDINVHGTKNFLNACQKSKVRKIVIASSVAAYGSLPGMPLLTEDVPLRGNRASYYSDTKRIVEEMLDEFERKNPDIILTRIRPSILCGRNTANSFRDILNAPVILYINTNKEGMPIVYENDAADAFIKVILNDFPGAFNIHAGTLSPLRIAEILGKRAVGLPFFIASILSTIGYWTGLLNFSRHWVELARYPFNIETEKALRVLNWRPTKTAEEAFVEMIKSEGH